TRIPERNSVFFLPLSLQPSSPSPFCLQVTAFLSPSFRIKFTDNEKLRPLHSASSPDRSSARCGSATASVAGPSLSVRRNLICLQIALLLCSKIGHPKLFNQAPPLTSPIVLPLTMEIDALPITEYDNNNGINNGIVIPTKSTPRRRKRNEYMHEDATHLAARKKKEMRIRLSLTRPSYVLGLSPKPLRSEHRRRLRYLLRRFVNQHDWVGASGVLSVYLKGTVNDTSPLKNRFKFWVLLELLKHVENHSISSINSTRIRNLYDIWSKKIGPMKTWPVESRYAVHLEFMLFYLMQGNAGDAYQLALCLEQEKIDIDPVSKIMMGLTFYELWYSSIPEEFQWRDLDQIDCQENSHMEGTSFSNEVGQSECQNSHMAQSERQITVESHMADTQYQCDSDASVMNERKISKGIVVSKDMRVSMEVDTSHKRGKSRQIFQSEGFYLISDEHKETDNPFSNSEDLTQDTLYALGKLDLWLLPLCFSGENNLEEFMDMHRNQHSDYYKNAVKYLQLALNSTSFASVALLPLTQLLLIGGQVNEVLTMLEQQCYNSHSVLPIRLRAILLERFDRNNSLLICSCFEEILKKDPACRDSLAKLIMMHQTGDYNLESLVEMIALHLDATDAEYNTWRVFSLCFSKLSLLEEDCMSACSIRNEDRQEQLRSLRKTPKIFTEGISGKSWNIRCRWWLTRYFSNSKFESSIGTGDLQLLTYKAACASYMYGREFSYVMKAYSHLEKENDMDLLLFLDEHKRNSYRIYEKFQTKLHG
uniref:Uncharacterized protein LOC101507338 n=2 Tax=Cicer arietinum TaxID=3827 RepID=A0A3Q7XHK2_CICAR